MQYWDSSAIVAVLDGDAEALRFWESGGAKKATRPHSLAETFSTLTGGRLARRYSPQDAAEAIDLLVKDGLAFVELDAPETLAAIRAARRKGVRGGLVHDWFHVVAAQKAKASVIVTHNIDHFSPLAGKIDLVRPV